VTSHQSHFFHDGNQLDRKSANIRLLDDDASVWLDDAPEFARGFSLVNDMMQGINKEDAVEKVVGERHGLGKCTGRL